MKCPAVSNAFPHAGGTGEEEEKEGEGAGGARWRFDCEEKKARRHERNRNGESEMVMWKRQFSSGVDLNSGGVNQYPACLPSWLAACSVRFAVTVATVDSFLY